MSIKKIDPIMEISSLSGFREKTQEERIMEINNYKSIQEFLIKKGKEVEQKEKIKAQSQNNNKEINKLFEVDTLAKLRMNSAISKYKKIQP